MKIYDDAHKLAKQIRESKEYKEYKELKENIEDGIDFNFDSGKEDAVDENDLKEGWNILRNKKYSGQIYMYDSENV